MYETNSDTARGAQQVCWTLHLDSTWTMPRLDPVIDWTMMATDRTTPLDGTVGRTMSGDRSMRGGGTMPVGWVNKLA